MMRWLILLGLMVFTSQSYANIPCLAEVIYAEAGGESDKGKIGLGQAALKRMKDQKLSVCQLVRRGIMHAKPIRNEKEKRRFKKIGQGVTEGRYPNYIGNANSWNRGRCPIKSGKVTAKIANHVFCYVAKL